MGFSGESKTFWCSSSSMIFSELPAPLTNPEDLDNLLKINTLFTGEFDQVLFKGCGPAKVIDDELGITLPAKNITELDRLSYVYS